ncbi:MAG: transposase [Rhodospirillales bacterium]|nr:transposase [Rhodospirillales bacterium]
MRAGLRFASDLTDAEWAVRHCCRRRRRRGPPAWPLHELVNAMFYVLRGGIPWRKLPPCFPPRQTVYGWFAAWRDAGVWQSIKIVDWSCLTASASGVRSVSVYRDMPL